LSKESDPLGTDKSRNVVEREVEEELVQEEADKEFFKEQGEDNELPNNGHGTDRMQINVGAEGDDVDEEKAARLLGLSHTAALPRKSSTQPQTMPPTQFSAILLAVRPQFQTAGHKTLPYSSLFYIIIIIISRAGKARQRTDSTSSCPTRTLISRRQ